MDLEVSCNAGGWQARFGNLAWPCAVGRGGVRKEKSEGDGATPAGCWPIRRVLYRADRLIRPETVFPCDPVRPDDAWCDAPSDPQYNTLVRLPHPTSHERLWREEAIYDCIAILGFNDSPVHAGAGSAIFLHIARQNLGPTEGCVALLQDHLLEFLRAAHRSSRVCVEPT